MKLHSYVSSPQNGADPDLAPEYVSPPLFHAIMVHSLQMVKILVKYRATIDKREIPLNAGRSRTPMHIAVDWKKTEIVQYLLEQGADPNACHSDGIPAIGAAADSGDPKLIQLLVDKGSHVNVTYLNKETAPLHEAVPFPETLRLLLQHVADITKFNSTSQTPWTLPFL
ncbi:unnamed protein product [Fusarium venenatum]|uniref:Uncharacterized protein n=1 Tax=Fusarium venenatum TaxID=56646 RepID=A0A2L2TDW3_9HYPO|nr:uncharacterized protein FVRRES_08236 [Fusarium venenatum]CEI68159.1 unnamed protein product [Fusarium venenatum]